MRKFKSVLLRPSCLLEPLGACEKRSCVICSLATTSPYVDWRLCFGGVALSFASRITEGASLVSCTPLTNPCGTSIFIAVANIIDLRLCDYKTLLCALSEINDVPVSFCSFKKKKKVLSQALPARIKCTCVRIYIHRFQRPGEPLIEFVESVVGHQRV
ncbi:hypothetical protein PR048_009422 [Dryococelus australis]|uniref:Uncharacterized protein n=1 Tax=Dryococelus australis TaxID=614101 RepID=A0ABQ9HZU5_9NEOP|nr:hypothetical protein PR048_009422 [Dryococelus australis]